MGLALNFADRRHLITMERNDYPWNETRTVFTLIINFGQNKGLLYVQII